MLEPCEVNIWAGGGPPNPNAANQGAKVREGKFIFRRKKGNPKDTLKVSFRGPFRGRGIADASEKIQPFISNRFPNDASPAPSIPLKVQSGVRCNDVCGSNCEPGRELSPRS
jgi:hypothetical protein